MHVFSADGGLLHSTPNYSWQFAKHDWSYLNPHLKEWRRAWGHARLSTDILRSGADAAPSTRMSCQGLAYLMSRRRMKLATHRVRVDTEMLSADWLLKYSRITEEPSRRHAVS